MMNNLEIEKRRTFGIISHPDAGKTTLTEKLLLFGGAIQSAGAVKNNKIKKTATSDFMEIEKQRGISVATSVMAFNYQNTQINILDTPGHKDFAEDTFRTLTAVDSVILVIDVANGVETQTEKLMEVCRMRKIPVIIFINKLDRYGKESFDLLDELENKLKIKVTPLSWPIGMGEGFKGVYNIHKKNLNIFSPNKTSISTNLYSINNKILKLSNSEVEILPILGCATDKKLIEKIFEEQNINMVFHAAAYKHVPIVESNPMQGILNNVISTKVLCEISFAYSVEKFCLISTDKAVRPTNIMGATKRLAELIVQYYSHKSSEINNSNNEIFDGTSFFMVRFGNVLNSSGSVVPLFKKQILQGGPVTITHKKVTRYFMTISEAAQLVLNSALFAKGEEVFLLDMGSPILIKQLAIQMIKLSGLTVKDVENPDGDIEIVYTGLRPGEKLFEELLIDAEAIPTANKKIFRATEKSAFRIISEYKLEKLINYSKNYDYESSLELLKELVPEWISN